ncbi:MAG: hypothetical protein GY679_03380 [Mycoplasma sp.]|nr:hypothetical protein [Mycoplasma sp.]
MLNQHEKCIEKSNGFCVSAGGFAEDGTAINFLSNKRSSSKYITDHKNHADYLLTLNEDVRCLKQITLLITIPPCYKCYLSMIEKLDIKKIFYICDPRNKVKKRAYLKKSKIPIIKYKEKDKKLLHLISQRTNKAMKGHQYLRSN